MLFQGQLSPGLVKPSILSYLITLHLLYFMEMSRTTFQRNVYDYENMSVYNFSLMLKKKMDIFYIYYLADCLKNTKMF